MKVGLLITNHGPHPPEKWAEQTAAQLVDIIQVEPDSLAYEVLTAQKVELEAELMQILTDDHSSVQTHERDAIAEQGMARLEEPLHPDTPHLGDAVYKVIARAKTKIFGAHFNKPEVVKFVQDVIGSHFGSVRYVERSWHADRNADQPEAQAFKTKFHSGV